MQLDTTQNACCAGDNTSNSCNVPTHGQQGCNCASQANPAKSAALLEKTFSIEATRQVIQHHIAPLNVAQEPAAIRGSGGWNNSGGGLLGGWGVTHTCLAAFIVLAGFWLVGG